MSGILAPAEAAALTALHLVLASAVTVHVLAHKRDPGSAVAWIGLAWLSPVVGSVLYALLGINRVRRRARGLRHTAAVGRAAVSGSAAQRDDHLAALEVAGSRISGRSVESGNAIVMLRNGDEAYPQMLAAIDGATASIALSSYIFRADAAGNEFIAAAIRAHERGVAVRVLIDGFGGGYLLAGAYRKLRAAQVPAAQFLHSALPWRMPFLNLRSHRKLLVIDGSVAFTGGLNIGAENLVSRRPRHPVLDTHFRFAGPVVAQLCEAFAEQWGFTTGEQLSGITWFPSIARAGTSTARAITSGPDQDLEKIELLILEAIGSARSTLKIMTPYFLPDDRIITALALAAMRGVTVDVVVPERTNHSSIDWAMRAHVEPLLEAGCRLWLHPPPFDHTKLLAIDGKWCFVGSANWDTRSFTLNFEINLEVYCTVTVQQVAAKITENQATRLTVANLAARSIPVRLRDSAARLFLPYL